MTGPLALDAHGQAALLRSGQLTSVELVTAALARAEQAQATLRPFVTLTPDRALAAARSADDLLATGAAPAFCGVPTAIKDLTPVAGVRSTLGSAAFVENVPVRDAHLVRLLREAGFVSIGTTNTPEFGLSSYTDNDVVGPTGTPADPARNAGGSSGGAAAAVAAGVVAVAPGSDGGGSIRIPASCCGVLGVKPTRGRTSPGPDGTDWNGLVGDGPLARSVRDAAAVLDLLAVPQVGDGRHVPASTEPLAAWVVRDPGRLRIAAWAEPYLPGFETDPGVRAVWSDTLATLEGLGHDVEIIDNPFPAALEPPFNVVWSSGVAAAPLSPEAEALLRPTTRYWRERGGQASAADLAGALSFLERTTRGVWERLAPYDLMVTPTLALPPQPHAWFTESGDPTEDHRRELAFTPFTAVWNMAGAPTASAPMGRVDGLPIGVMLTAHPGRDGLLLAVLSSLEPTWRSKPGSSHAPSG